MPHQGDTNSIGDLPVNQVIRKPLEVGPMKTCSGEVKSPWAAGCHRRHAPQFLHEIVSQTLRNRIVIPERLRHVILDLWMVFNPHRFRRACTR